MITMYDHFVNCVHVRDRRGKTSMRELPPERDGMNPTKVCSSGAGDVQCMPRMPKSTEKKHLPGGAEQNLALPVYFRSCRTLYRLFNLDMVVSWHCSCARQSQAAPKGVPRIHIGRDDLWSKANYSPSQWEGCLLRVLTTRMT